MKYLLPENGEDTTGFKNMYVASSESEIGMTKPAKIMNTVGRYTKEVCITSRLNADEFTGIFYTLVTHRWLQHILTNRTTSLTTTTTYTTAIMFNNALKSTSYTCTPHLENIGWFYHLHIIACDTEFVILDRPSILPFYHKLSLQYAQRFTIEQRRKIVDS